MFGNFVEMDRRMVKKKKMNKVMGKAEEKTNKKLVTLLVPKTKKQSGVKNPFEMIFSSQEKDEDEDQDEDDEIKNKRKRTEQLLALGELEDHTVTVEIEEMPPSKIGRAHV